MRPKPNRALDPIETEHLILRRSRADDAAAISAYRSDPAVHRYQGWPRTDPEGVGAGRGYATEAIGALVIFAFDVLGAEVVRAYASAENLPSIRVAEKVGMQLMERFERSYGGRTWLGVRYEIRRV